MKLRNKKVKAAFVLVFFMIFFSGAYFLLSGKTQEINPNSNSLPQPSFWGLAFKTLIVLGFIIVLVYVVLFLLKRFVYRKNFGKPNNSIEMLDFVPLVAKKSLCVVKVVDRILVLGISENNITKLSEIKDQNEQQVWMAKITKQSSKKSGSFAEQLQNLLGQSKS